MAERLRIELVAAFPGRAFRIELSVPHGVTVRNVIERARLDERLPELDLTQCSVGIFGVRCALDTLVKDGDRIEIYRPLVADPKTQRRQRAAR